MMQQVNHLNMFELFLCVQSCTVACSNNEALKSMDEFKKGLQQRLVDHEQELKSGKSNNAGSSRE